MQLPSVSLAGKNRQPGEREVAVEDGARLAEVEPAREHGEHEEKDEPEDQAAEELHGVAGKVPKGIGARTLPSRWSSSAAMPSYNVYHVTLRDDRWVARLQGSPTISASAASREETVAAAEGIIRQLGAGRIVLHAEDGVIESVHTFEQITAPPGGWTHALTSRPVWLGVAAACLVGLGFALRGRE